MQLVINRFNCQGSPFVEPLVCAQKRSLGLHYPPNKAGGQVAAAEIASIIDLYQVSVLLDDLICETAHKALKQIGESVKVVWRHIVVLFQVFALLMYQQASTIVHDAAAAQDATTIAVSHNHHSGSEAQHSHSDHSNKTKGFIGGSVEAHFAPLKNHRLACHPCCAVGRGPCVVLASAEAELLKPSFARSFVHIEKLIPQPLQRKPNPHPPKTRA